MRARLAALLLLVLLAAPALADYPCPSGYEQTTQTWSAGGLTNYQQVCTAKPTPTPIAWQSSWSQWLPTPVPTMAPSAIAPLVAPYVPTPIPQPTFAYVAPTPQTAAVYPTPVPTLAPFVYVAPTPQTIPTLVPTPAQFSAVYAPASLAAGAARCDPVAVVGIVTGKPILATPGASVAANYVLSSNPYPSAANTVTICWRSLATTGSAVPMASSTWFFKQP